MPTDVSWQRTRSLNLLTLTAASAGGAVALAYAMEVRSGVHTAKKFLERKLAAAATTTPSPEPSPAAEPARDLEPIDLGETCRNGHERKGNTYLRADGRKECSLCRRERKRLNRESPTGLAQIRGGRQRIVIKLRDVRITIEPGASAESATR
jgi:hypothetical protein